MFIFFTVVSYTENLSRKTALFKNKAFEKNLISSSYQNTDDPSHRGAKCFQLRRKAAFALYQTDFLFHLFGKGKIRGNSNWIYAENKLSAFARVRFNKIAEFRFN